MRPRFGVRTVLYRQRFEPIKDYVLAAEKLGYDAIWINDHLLPIVGSVKKPMLECWTVLSSLAPLTKRIRLGPLVLNNNFRHPQLLAKMACTLDVVSRGRLELGIGAGWYEREHKAFGLSLPKHPERMKMLEESIVLIKRLWTGRRTSFRGRFYHVKDAICLPEPVQKPHPPLLVGGNSGRVLDLMARHADKANFLLVSSDDFAQKVKELKDKCSRTGRDYSKITKSFFGEAMVVRSDREAEEQIRKRLRERRLPLARSKEYSHRCIIGTQDRCVERINEYVRAGAGEFMLVFPDLSMRQIEIFADSVIPCLS